MQVTPHMPDIIVNDLPSKPKNRGYAMASPERYQRRSAQDAEVRGIGGSGDE